jgi:DNA-binding IclR family transcriptional regulator
VREGVYSMGAPVFDAAGQPVAAIGVCINRALLGTDHGERQRQAVLNAARLLSQRLGGEPPVPAVPRSGTHRRLSPKAGS